MKKPTAVELATSYALEEDLSLCGLCDELLKEYHAKHSDIEPASFEYQCGHVYIGDGMGWFYYSGNKEAEAAPAEGDPED